jgi:hypothetical protein
MLTASIVNKILHMPTVKMKEVAGSQECYLYVDAVRTLFDLRGNGAAARGDHASASGDLATTGTVDPPGATVHPLRGTGTENA